MTLTERLIGACAAGADGAFDVFLDWSGERGFSLYAAQEEAVLALAGGAHVLLATPTGSGKSLVAVAAHAQALAQGRPSWYTAPIKALVSEKFFALVEIFGAEKVGMLTGDAAVNRDAPIICATAEVLANHALRDRQLADIGLVVMDEFHFYTDPDRGWAWQVPLLLLPQTQFLLMSATLGETGAFEEDLTRRTGSEAIAITGAERPVPLEFSWVLTPVHETIELLLRSERAPVYVVSFTQAAAVEQAQALASVEVVGSAGKAAIKDAVGGFRFGKGFGATLRRLVLHGIGVHHAGMLPKYRRLVETLAQAGLLAVICGTDTLGVGINVPIRTVLLTSLTKYDGRKQRVLRAREFHQIAGRAGRAGFDTVGYVVVQAPEHVVENEKALARAGQDPKKRRRVVRRKPPEGTLSYTESTYERLVDGATGAAHLEDAGQPRDGAQRAGPLAGTAGRPAHPAAGQPRGAGPARGTRRARRPGAGLAAAGPGRRAGRRLDPRGLAACRCAGSHCRRGWFVVSGYRTRRPGDRPRQRERGGAHTAAGVGSWTHRPAPGGRRPTGRAGAGRCGCCTDRAHQHRVGASATIGAGAVRPSRGPALRRGPVPGGARAARRVRAQPAAVGVRPGDPADARPAGPRIRPGRRQRHRGNAAGPAAGAHGAAVRGPRRGGRCHEGRRDGLRGADGRPRGPDLAPAAGRRSSRGRCASTGNATRGSTPATCRRSRSCARCTSGA